MDIFIPMRVDGQNIFSAPQNANLCLLARKRQGRLDFLRQKKLIHDYS